MPEQHDNPTDITTGQTCTPMQESGSGSGSAVQQSEQRQGRLHVACMVHAHVTTHIVGVVSLHYDTNTCEAGCRVLSVSAAPALEREFYA